MSEEPKDKRESLAAQSVKTVGEIAKAYSGEWILDAIERGFHIAKNSPMAQVYFLRYLPKQHENLIAIADLIKRINRDRGIPENFVPSMAPRILLPYLDLASQEDDQDIQELWAALYANHADPNRRQPIRKLYLRVLSGLDPLDVGVMKKMEELDGITESGKSIDATRIAAELAISLEELELSLTNLAQTGCLMKWSNQQVITMEQSPSPPWYVGTAEAEYALSMLGREILQACSID